MPAALLLAASLLNQTALLELLRGTPRAVMLPAGTIEVRSAIQIPAGFSLQGHPRGTVLKASEQFGDKAILIAESNVSVSHLVLDGSRAANEQVREMAPSDRTFIDYYGRNGIAASKVRSLKLSNLTIRNVANFAVVISESDNVTIERLHVSDSGSTKKNGRNNTSGGILLEEGTANFTVRLCRLERIRGNGIWTHSRYTSRRNGPGLIEANSFDTIGRDAIQAGHATLITVRNNTGTRIGWPLEIVDVEGGGTPVGIDTAGDVDASVYSGNRFHEINGKCIDLDGFHHGRVESNTCVNVRAAERYPFGHYGIVFNNTNPDMRSESIVVARNVIDGTKFGGIFVIGRNHTIRGNRLRRINLARCNESAAKFGCLYDPKQPDLLRSGIYLGSGAERPDPAQHNVIADNVITGYGMQAHCLAYAPGVDAKKQKTERNECRNSTVR